MHLKHRKRKKKHIFLVWFEVLAGKRTGIGHIHTYVHTKTYAHTKVSAINVFKSYAEVHAAKILFLRIFHFIIISFLIAFHFHLWN